MLASELPLHPAVPLQPNERRIWVDGVPKSSQGKAKMNRAYVERIKSAAQREFVAPVAGPVEITIVFKDWSSRPDVDNVEKVAIDALKGIVFIDDKQVRKVTTATIDDCIIDLTGDDHRTFRQILGGEKFLIRILVDPPPIAWEVKSS
jgi:Holliday junction resolvase RusA-like endonuclease